MAGRGRGRGGGHSFNREMSDRLGLGGGGGGGETQIESVLEPPPVFPLLENRPVPLDLGVEG